MFPFLAFSCVTCRGMEARMFHVSLVLRNFQRDEGLYVSQTMVLLSSVYMIAMHHGPHILLHLIKYVNRVSTWISIGFTT